MVDYYEYSIPELVKLLGARFKDYRLRSHMTQKEVSEQSGITITTIHKLMPDLPPSAYLMKEEKKVQRIRHKKS